MADRATTDTAARDDATPEASAQRETKARPDRGQADDGKTGGQMHTGKPGKSNAPGAAAERHAPGMPEDDRK